MNSTSAPNYGSTSTQERAKCPSGRVEVSGVVLSTKITPDRGYGIGRKMLIELDNGVRIYGNAPLGVDKGNKITMKATLEQSRNDASFGTFTRPIILSNTRPAPQVAATSEAREHWYQRL